MANIVIDTNIYRKNPSRSDLAFQALARLCRENVHVLHVPFMVRREFETYQRGEYRKNVDDASRSLGAILRRGLSEKWTSIVTQLKEQLDAAGGEVVSDGEAGLNRWVAEVGAQAPSLTLEEFEKGMEAYLSGSPPLVEPKNRDDIPDSLIFQQILRIAKDGPLYVVSGDGRLAAACADVTGVRVFRELSEFIESDEIQNQLFALDVDEDPSKLAHLVSECVAGDAQLSDRVKDAALGALILKRIRSPEIPDDNNEATIHAYGDAEEFELELAEITYFGNGEFGVPFRLRAPVYADFYIYKPDYYVLDKQYSVSDHSDHYFAAEDEFDVVASGTVKFSVPLDGSAKVTAENVSEMVSVQLDSIDEIEVLG